MRRKILIVAATACTLSQASLAATIKYYSRQTLPGLVNPSSSADPTSPTDPTTPSYTYTPTYGAFGTCSANSQTATITACTRNDGKNVNLTSCQPQSISQPCVSSGGTCGTLTKGHSASGSFTNVASGIQDVDSAQQACQNYFDAHGIASGSCVWNSSSSTVTGRTAFSVTAGTQQTSGTAASQLYGAVCK